MPKYNNPPGAGFKWTYDKPMAFTEDDIQALVASLEQGYSVNQTLRNCGKDYKVFRTWMRRGGDPNDDPHKVCPPHIVVEPYHTFQVRINEAIRKGRHVRLPRPPSGQAPKDITVEQQTTILEAVRDGYSLHSAASRAGIPARRLTSWLHRGGFPRQVTANYPIPADMIIEPYHSFAKEVIRAEEEFFAILDSPS